MRRALPLLWLAACAPAPQQAPTPGLANPAADFCIQQGGTVIEDQAGAAEAGWCRLPSGLVVEEWAFYREMNPA